MTKKDFILFAEKMNISYPGYQFLVTPECAEWWYELLGDLSLDAALGALRMHSMVSRTPPTAADIRGSAAVSEASFPAPEEAWGEISRAVRYYGYPRAKEAMESFSEPVKNIVHGIGFQNICRTPMSQISALRSHFERAYEAECKALLKQRSWPAQEWSKGHK